MTQFQRMVIGFRNADTGKPYGPLTFGIGKVSVVEKIEQRLAQLAPLMLEPRKEVFVIRTEASEEAGKALAIYWQALRKQQNEKQKLANLK
jgi:hypothetical protein